MTDLAYYTYISATKIDMLRSQLRRRPALSFRAKVAALGGEVEVGSTPEANASLIRQTQRVVRTLRKRGAAAPLDGQSRLGSSYYADTATWAHGLFSFGGDFGLGKGDGRVISYLLWRRWGSAVILLAGSPHNVLGEKVVHDGVWAYGTTGTWASVLQFAQHHLHTDEPAYVTVGQPEQPAPALWTPWRAEDLAERRTNMPPNLNALPPAVALAYLCVDKLTTLPRGTVDTTFRVFGEYPLPPVSTLPRSDLVALDRHAGSPAWRHALHGCDTVYVGSPLYVSLGTDRTVR